MEPDELARVVADNERLAKEVKRLVRTEVELFESHRLLDRQLRIYEHLHQVGKKLNATFDRGEILVHAVKFPVYELGFQRAVVLGRFESVGEPTRFAPIAHEGYYGAEAQAQLKEARIDLDRLHPGLADGEELLRLPNAAADAPGHQLALALGMSELAAYPVGGEPGRYDGLLVVGTQADKVHLHSRVEVGSGILIGMANFASHVSTAIKHAAAFQDLVVERRLLEAKVQQRTAELERAHGRLLRFEKESLEMQMVGGFAHEMRNAVGAIETLVSIALDDVSGLVGGSLTDQNAKHLEQLFLTVRTHLPKPTLHEAVGLVRSIVDNEEQLGKILSGIRSASSRALGITTALLEYSRLGRSVRGADRIDLRRLVEQLMQSGVAELRRDGIVAEVVLPPSLFVRGTDTHFNSILSNLVNNARDAMTEVDDGRARRLVVSVRRDGAYIEMSVADTGRGIPRDVLPRIYEPFYSTKPKTGTGLGLGVCKKLVELYAGKIEIQTEEGKGTTFTVKLPAESLVEE